MNFIYVALGGALGSVSRYYATERVADWRGTPGLGVFVVNIVGSFLIGLFLALSEERFMWSPHIRLLVAVGFLGGFTTFSTLMSETRGMLELRDVAAASLNIGGSIVCGLLAVYLGSAIGRQV